MTLGRFMTGRTVFRSFAYCSERPTRIRSKAYFLRGTGRLRSLATPRCPRGTLAVSAGFFSPFTFSGGSDAGATIPLETSRLNRKRWRIGVVPISAGLSRSTAYSYCGSAGGWGGGAGPSPGCSGISSIFPPGSAIRATMKQTTITPAIA